MVPLRASTFQYQFATSVESSGLLAHMHDAKVADRGNLSWLQDLGSFGALVAQVDTFPGEFYIVPIWFQVRGTKRHDFIFWSLLSGHQNPLISMVALTLSGDGILVPIPKRQSESLKSGWRPLAASQNGFTKLHLHPKNLGIQKSRSARWIKMVQGPKWRREMTATWCAYVCLYSISCHRCLMRSCFTDRSRDSSPPADSRVENHLCSRIITGAKPRKKMIKIEPCRPKDSMIFDQWWIALTRDITSFLYLPER